MIPSRPSTRFLASVRSVDEARLAVAGGADVIDCKDPEMGALGALPVSTVRAIRKAVSPHIAVSATIGDLVPEPVSVTAAAAAMAATGVDYVKLGFFPGGDARATIAALALLARSRVRLVGLLLADRDPDFSLIEAMADAGFAGVMLDTAGKSAGALPAVLSQDQLGGFVSEAHSHGLFAGFAGSLRLNHVPQLLALNPDLIGFRGALCRANERCGTLDPEAMKAIREAIPAAVAAPGLPQKVLS